MKIIVCYKAVPDSETIGVNSDRSLEFGATTSYVIGQYDFNAVEAAAKLAEDTGAELAALTVGGELVANTKMQKAVLSRGPAAMYGVRDAAADGADLFAVTGVLKAAAEKIGADLVICGEGSGDMYSQQTGNMLGAMLGWTTLNSVSAIEPTEGGLRLERTVEDGVEVLDVSLPAVLSVTTDINRPRIPTMKNIMAAGKKPTTIWSLADMGIAAEGRSEVLDVRAPKETARKQIVLEGLTGDNVQQFAEYVKAAF